MGAKHWWRTFYLLTPTIYSTLLFQNVKKWVFFLNVFINLVKEGVAQGHIYFDDLFIFSNIGTVIEIKIKSKNQQKCKKVFKLNNNSLCSMYLPINVILFTAILVVGICFYFNLNSEKIRFLYDIIVLFMHKVNK